MVTTWTRVLLFWAVAAVLVACVDGISLKTAAIILVAFAYMRLRAPEMTLDHALFTGVTWLALTIAAELVMTRNLRRNWFLLLGSPDSALRNILMFAWIFAPALFARPHD